jgi:hypothetical protein
MTWQRSNNGVVRLVVDSKTGKQAKDPWGHGIVFMDPSLQDKTKIYKSEHASEHLVYVSRRIRRRRDPQKGNGILGIACQSQVEAVQLRFSQGNIFQH